MSKLKISLPITLSLIFVIGTFSACEDSFLARKLRQRSKPAATEPAANPAPKTDTANPSPIESSDSKAAENPLNQLIKKKQEGTIANQEFQKNRSEDQDLVEKTNLYVDCLNRTQERVASSKRRYLSWTSEASGPTCKERYVSYSIYPLYPDGVEKCQRAATLGAAKPPSLPVLENYATQLATAYAQLVPLTQQTHDYYSQEDYKDDACAKGKTLHPKLMAQFSAFETAQAGIIKELDPLKKDLTKRELANLEKQGKGLPWYSKKLLLSAQELKDLTPGNPGQNWDAAAFLNQFQILETDFQAMENYLLANPGATNGVFWADSFTRSSKDFYVQAKFLKRELVEKKQGNARTTKKFFDKYNGFVRDGNNLKFK